ncbi:halocyanin hcpE [Haladaptatus paucihalophilus DX253]|uniref:Halocyanin hcpE n=1 Tax=Haladaptatus paucihalophilus DX253 TaxID=797209 RepID=E7QRP3_HALPU|nr:plastocyanin/azurin family copper-binding protein [Haladaptatus paucihalophilus]EFW92662.1 halocyanin hcpE [Haladaptatus paucihalophilus DX253]SHK16420.1 Plastocyanin [Haladaptatus paucihalophilus DX253]
MTESESGTTRRAYLRRIGVSGALGVIGGLAGCTSSSDGGTTTPTTAVDADATVEVGPDYEYGFEPGTGKPLHVSTGDTVLWVWKSNTHNIIVGSQPDGANWDGTPGGRSDVYDAGYRYHYTFEVPGKYHYWCQPHKAMGMVADIVVEE